MHEWDLEDIYSRDGLAYGLSNSKNRFSYANSFSI
jgi:hypothetical protein